MSRHRDFDAARAEREGEPLTFELGGRTWTCLPAIPSGPVLDLAAKAEEEGAEAVVAFVDFLKAAVADDQRDEFVVVLATIDLETLVELAGWILEEATGRPLENASSSPALPSSDGDTSKPDSPSQVAEIRSA